MRVPRPSPRQPRRGARGAVSKSTPGRGKGGATRLAPSDHSPGTGNPDSPSGSIAGRKKNLYITIDLDCLGSGAVFTNWENGRFTVDDLVWALGQARGKARVIGGDLCGAWSPPGYGSAFQSLAARFDHPKIEPPAPAELATRHEQIFRQLWPALTGRELE